MTKGEAYKKYRLDTNHVNFNPNEEADADFIAGCKALSRGKRKVLSTQLMGVLADIDKMTSKAESRMVKFALLMDVVKSLFNEDKISPDLAAFIMTVVHVGCEPDIAFKALDKMGDIIAELEEESEEKNND